MTTLVLLSPDSRRMREFLGAVNHRYRVLVFTSVPTQQLHASTGDVLPHGVQPSRTRKSIGLFHRRQYVPSLDPSMLAFLTVI